MSFIFFGAVIFGVYISSGILGSPPWNIEFLGDKESFSSGGSIDVVLQINAGSVLEGATASISLPFGWSVSSGPSKYVLGDVTGKAVVGWTIYGGSKESLGEVTATVTSLNPETSETIKLSQANSLPRIDPANIVSSGGDSKKQNESKAEYSVNEKATDNDIWTKSQALRALYYIMLSLAAAILALAARSIYRKMRSNKKEAPADNKYSFE